MLATTGCDPNPNPEAHGPGQTNSAQASYSPRELETNKDCNEDGRVDLDIVHPATGLVNEMDEDSPGGLVAVFGPNRPITRLIVGGMGPKLKGTFSFSHSPLISLWLDSSFTQPLPASKDAQNGITIFVKGNEISRTRGDQSVNVSWNGSVQISKASDSVALTVVNAEVRFEIASFIPYVWTDPRFPDSLDLYPSFVAVGDGRSFAPPSVLEATYRVRQNIGLNPHAELSANGIIPSLTYARAGNSTHYTKNAIPPSARNDLHGVCCPSPAPAWLVADGPGKIITHEAQDLGLTADGVHRFRFSAAGIDGALNIAELLGALLVDASIWWLIDVHLNVEEPLALKYTISGLRKQFPAYEMYVSSLSPTPVWQPVFQWKPPFSRTVFPYIFKTES